MDSITGISIILDVFVLLLMAPALVVGGLVLAFELNRKMNGHDLSGLVAPLSKIVVGVSGLYLVLVSAIALLIGFDVVTLCLSILAVLIGAVFVIIALRRVIIFILQSVSFS